MGRPPTVLSPMPRPNIAAGWRSARLPLIWWRANCPMAERASADAQHPVTPDGRYFVVLGRLWRTADPSLDEARRAHLVRQLMAARR